MSERSISAMATRKPRPSPSETATCRAIEPGPAMLASASARGSGLVRRKRAASFCNSQPKPSRQEKARNDAGGDGERDGALLGSRDGESKEREPARRRGDDEGERRPLLLVW